MTQLTAQILDGKALAQTLLQQLQTEIEALKFQFGRAPGLAVIMVGDNPASAAYVRNKERACQRAGIVSFGRHFPTTTSNQELYQLIQELNQNPEVDGILIQLPLPPHLDTVGLLRAIDPHKDADGLHPTNLGKLLRSEPTVPSCTPAGVMKLIDAYNLPLERKRAVVVGRSILVGKPLAIMLLEANATVTVAHSRTQNLTRVCREADILIAAVGKPKLLTQEMVKPGAVVIDVGINRIETAEGQSRLVGDVDFDAVEKVAGYLTPVPGGVGPMTVAMLLQNTFDNYKRSIGVR